MSDILDQIVTGFEVDPPVYPAREPITYERYMQEPPLKRRYDILDGIRVYGWFNSFEHQDLCGEIVCRLGEYDDEHDFGLVLVLPHDLLVTREPFRTRQADVAIVSYRRLEMSMHPDDGSPLAAAPELAVEVLERTESISDLNEKLSDFASIGIDECWVIDPSAQRVTLLRHQDDMYEPAQTCTRGETLTSMVLPGFQLDVNNLFAETAI